MKRRRIQQMQMQTGNLSNIFDLGKYDGSRQALRKMINSMSKDMHELKYEVTDITKVMEKVRDKMQKYEQEGMHHPHKDHQWQELYRDMDFYDDVNGGQKMDKEQTIRARRDEMTYFKRRGVYSKVHKSEIKKTGGKVISIKWVDTVKNGGVYRSRLVGRELKFDKRQDLFSPTPPREIMKMLIAKCAKSQSRRKPLRVGVFDISRAYFYAPCKRAIFIKIPMEDWEPGDEDMVGRLNLSLYGTRDAAQNWAAAYSEYLEKNGFKKGKGSLCNFYHQARDISLTVHGDDFLVVADMEQLKWLEGRLQDQYEIKSTIIGPEGGLPKQANILNRIIRWTTSGIEYEADPKHANIIMEECEIMDSRPSKVTGVPEKFHDEDQLELLDEASATRFRAVAARTNYLAQDRTDLQFAAKNLSRRMARPTTLDWESAKKLARYLKLKPRAVQTFRFEEEDGQIRGYADSDWAGEKATAKSTSGGGTYVGLGIVEILVHSSIHRRIEYGRGGALRLE